MPQVGPVGGGELLVLLKTFRDGGTRPRAGLSSGLIRRGSRASAEDRTRPQLQVTDRADLPRTHAHRLGKRVGGNSKASLPEGLPPPVPPAPRGSGRPGASTPYRPARPAPFFEGPRYERRRSALARPLRPGADDMPGKVQGERAGLRSGDGLRSVRARPSSLKNRPDRKTFKERNFFHGGP